MMNNSWNLKGDAATYQKYDKGWANENPSKPAPKKEYLHPQQPVQRSGMPSQDNPLASGTRDLFKRPTTAARAALAEQMHYGPPVEKEERRFKDRQMQKGAQQQMAPRDPYQGGYNPQPTQNPKIDMQAQVVIQNTQAVPKF